MIRIIFLGSSGSTPTVARAMPGIALKYESELMLWDCGEGTQRQLMKYKVGYGSVSSIFISHPHLDHYLGMFGLLETLKLSSAAPKPVNIFLPRGMDLEGYPFAKIEKIKAGELMHRRGFTISAFAVKHCTGSHGFVFQEDEKVKFHEKKAHSLGLKGKLFREIQQKGKVKTAKGTIKLEDITWTKPGRKVVYAGDCAASDNTIKAAKDADLLIHEATFDSSKKEEAEERSHSTAKGAAKVAKAAKVKRLVLTHISPRYADVSELLKEAKSVFKKTEVAKDGLSIDI